MERERERERERESTIYYVNLAYNPYKRMNAFEIKHNLYHKNINN